jgi:uncharacterized protein YciI
MPYFALFYHVVDNFISRRAPFRQEHLRLVGAAHDRGEIVMAGALADPPDLALLVFQGHDRTIAVDFAARDPYVTQGLVAKVEVRPWTVVVPAEQQP